MGQLIKNIRVDKELTQQDLADLLKVDRQYIWKIEQGKVNLTLEYLEKIISCLRCNNRDFFSHLK